MFSWNALMLLAMWLNDGWGTYRDARALLVLSVACFALGSFGVATVMSQRFRYLVTAPQRRGRYDPSPYLLVAFVTFLLAIATLFSAVGQG